MLYLRIQQKFIIPVFGCLLIACLLWLPALAAFVALQNETKALHFAVIGDSGDGSDEQAAVAQQMLRQREQTPFDFVLMLGDNIYGGGKPKYFKPYFEDPYKDLLGAGVKFYASLGNHDAGSVEAHLKYDKFNMDGKRYYNFTRNGNLIEFFALDTNAVTPEQLSWLEKELENSKARWKVAFFHHSLFSSAKMHPPYLKLRQQLHPLFIKYKVNLVLSGHSHVYERVKPQDGIQYITEGCSGKIMKRNLNRASPLLQFGNDEVQSFLLVQVNEQELKVNAIDLNGKLFDSVTLQRSNAN